MPTASGHTTAIRASRVIGSKVFLQSGDAIGEVGDVVLDKTSDRIMFAVISRDGAMTATDNFYPVPWSVLDYDEQRQAYVVPFSKEHLAGAPAVSSLSSLTDSDGAAVRDSVLGHYQAAR